LLQVITVFEVNSKKLNSYHKLCIRGVAEYAL